MRTVPQSTNVTMSSSQSSSKSSSQSISTLLSSPVRRLRDLAADKQPFKDYRNNAGQPARSIGIENPLKTHILEWDASVSDGRGRSYRCESADKIPLNDDCPVRVMYDMLFGRGGTYADRV